MPTVPKAGLGAMLKDGAKYFHGLDEAVFRNLEACKELSLITRTSYGPNGMDKMVINHLDKLFVTKDAATMLQELEVQHPAAKMLVLGCKMMQEEVGDGTNFVMVFGGALLEQAVELLRMGLSPTEVVEGYEVARKKCLEFLENIVVQTVEDPKVESAVRPVVSTAVATKQFGVEDVLGSLVLDACLNIVPENPKSFNVDNIFIKKIAGGGVHNSIVQKGLVFLRKIEGDVTNVRNAKIVVYTGDFDLAKTETKGTVLLKSASELLQFNKGEETVCEEFIKGLSEAGVNVLVCGGSLSDMCLHYLNRHKILALRLLSKFDVRRLCKATGSTPLPKMTLPTPEELGHCDEVTLREIGDTFVTVFDRASEGSSMASIVIRGSADSIMDEMERAINDGVNTYRTVAKDGRLVAGGGACEMELAKQLTAYAETCPGLEQYAIERFSTALESVVRVLASNAGMKASKVASLLIAEHQKGNSNAGINVLDEKNPVLDSVKEGIVDLYAVKHLGIKLATNAACTILRVDQIIMAKPAGGPKPKDNPNWDED